MTLWQIKLLHGPNNDLLILKLWDIVKIAKNDIFWCPITVTVTNRAGNRRVPLIPNYVSINHDLLCSLNLDSN